MFQGTCLIGVVFAWHAVVPLAVLHLVDKLFPGVARFPELANIPQKGISYGSSPGVAFTVISLPYMIDLFPTLTNWVAAIPGLNPPAYSIFRDPSGVYSMLPTWLVGLGLVGNFLCEELYFHGYLMKKIGFLGAWAWVVNSVLFALYHIWQLPQLGRSSGLFSSSA
jgi:membrane protease YdiL (CAAX protease family)